MKIRIAASIRLVRTQYSFPFQSRILHACYRGWPCLHRKIRRCIRVKNYPRYQRNSRFERFKKTFKKVQKKLASPRRVPLNGDLTRQVGAEDRSKKL